MPRLIKLRSEGDVGYVDVDDVKTVKQRLADREAILRELKDMMRRHTSDVPGAKLRKHEWKMTAIADLPPALWEEEELLREAKHNIQDRAVEKERSPPPSPGRMLIRRPVSAAAPKPRRKAPPEVEQVREVPTTGARASTDTPRSNSHAPLEEVAVEDQKVAPPRQDTVMRSVEAPSAPASHIASRDRESQMLANRTPVCKHCWDNRHWCDSLEACSNCKISGAKCIYMRCKSGGRCKVPRCLHIHPDQYGDQNSTRLVDEGSLQYKDPRRQPTRRAFEDSLDPRGRRAGESTKKRARSPEPSDMYEDFSTRKSVCQHCFDARILCDFNGCCKPCRHAGLKCVRIHCKQGLACRSRKCPCVHPGQYDLYDTTWNVEHGDLWKSREE